MPREPILLVRKWEWRGRRYWQTATQLRKLRFGIRQSCHVSSEREKCAGTTSTIPQHSISWKRVSPLKQLNSS